MRSELLSLLLRVDDAAMVERPRGFDREASLEAVRALARPLSAIAERELREDSAVEDASFFADLAAYDPPVRGVSHPVVIVRFSAFGRLCTVMNGRVPEHAVATIMELLEAAGWIYIPYDEVDGVPYSGSNPHLAGHSWAQRFFDYL